MRSAPAAGVLEPREHVCTCGEHVYACGERGRTCGEHLYACGERGRTCGATRPTDVRSARP